MAILNTWQRIDRVLPGMPFGDGIHGNYSSATAPTVKYKSSSGTASASTLTADTDVDPYSVGDVIGIYQTRGTGVGQWEINRIVAVGSDQYTLNKPLHYTYTDSGASQAQSFRIFRYTNLTTQSGTWSTTNWDGEIGGLLPIAVMGRWTVAGTVSLSGTNGNNVNPTSSSSVGGVGGFRGGVAIRDATGYQGEGSAGPGTQSTSANGNGGGGSTGSGTDNASAGGGGHKNAGSNGKAGTGTVGTGGNSVASSDLITFILGGGGGGNGTTGSNVIQGAGAGGGKGLLAYVNDFVITTGSISLNGGNGGSGDVFRQGGDGSGGPCLIVCRKATLGTNTITSLGGTTQSNGSVGQIAIHHSGAVTGTTNPTFTDVEDRTLVESGGAALFALL